MNNSKQPINPTILTRVGDGDDDFEAANPYNRTGYEMSFSGLTKREHFAGLAMQAMISADVFKSTKHIAEQAVLYADALLLELDK